MKHKRVIDEINRGVAVKPPQALWVVPWSTVWSHMDTRITLVLRPIVTQVYTAWERNKHET